jgi:hypothetical protein
VRDEQLYSGGQDNGDDEESNARNQKNYSRAAKPGEGGGGEMGTASAWDGEVKKGVPGVLPCGVDDDNLCGLSAAGGAEAGATRLVLHESGIRLIGVAAAGG